MSTLLLETDNTESVSVVKVKGRVDSETTPELDGALSKLLAEGKNKIVLDMQAVEYMSSAGLRTLVKTLKGAQGAGGNLHLASLPKDIEGILLTVGMMQMFKIFSTSQEAAAGF